MCGNAVPVSAFRVTLFAHVIPVSVFCDILFETTVPVSAVTLLEMTSVLFASVQVINETTRTHPKKCDVA